MQELQHRALEKYRDQISALDPLIAFVVANSVGPSTSAIYCMYLGAQYGFRGALPFTMGTSFGFTLVLVTTALALSAELTVPAVLAIALQALATAYTLWLASRFVRNAFLREQTQSGMRRFGFGSGIGQQLSNPKSWLLAGVTLSAFSDKEVSAISEAAHISILYAACGVPVALAWTSLGSMRLAWFERLKRPLAVVSATLLVYTATKIWSSG